MLTRLLPAILAATVLLAAPAQASSREATHIVQLRDGVSLAEGQAIVRAADGQVADTLPIIRGLAVRLSPSAQARLARDGRIARVSVNARTYSTFKSVRPPSNGIDPSRLQAAYPFSVLAPQSWAVANGAGVGVAVIDTGIDGSLEDFTGDDGASRIVASVVTNPGATTPNDTYGHGTHVAGIIAGDGTRRDDDDPAAGKYIGIAPRANLITIKAADDAGRGTILDAIYGLQFAVDHKAEYNIRVVNLSLSSTVAESYRTDPLDAAVESAYFHGILVVAAVGNRGAAADATSYAPGNDPFALSVGAVDDKGTDDRSDDAFTDWSSVGATQDGFAKPEIAAPGAHIVSTLARDSAFASACPSCIVDESYIRLGGSSMAAPIVSGVAALLFQLHPDWTPDQVKSTLIDTARNVSGAVNEVNAAAALGVQIAFVGRQRGRGAEPPDRRRDRRHRLHALELGTLQLGRRAGQPRRRLGALQLGVHMRRHAERHARFDPLELGSLDMAGTMGLLMRASWG